MTIKVLRTKDGIYLLDKRDKTFSRHSGYRKYVHGGVAWDSDERMTIAFFSSKSKMKFIDKVFNNVPINEDLNPIDYVNIPINLSKDDFIRYVKVDQNLDNFLTSPNWEGGTPANAFYCSLLAFEKSLASQQAIVLNTNNNIQQSEHFTTFINDGRVSYRPAEGILLLKDADPTTLNNFREIYNSIPEEDIAFKEQFLLGYRNLHAENVINFDAYILSKKI